MVEWVLLAIAGWIVNKALDALWERMKRDRQRAPLNDVQVLAHHRHWYRAALVPFALCLVATTGAMATSAAADRTPLWYAGLAFLVAMTVYLFRVMRRRRRRLREAEASARRRGVIQ